MLRVTEDSVSLTDTGLQRRANEDSHFARPPLFVVADGMGGARAGEVASRIAANSFEPGLPPDVEVEHGLAQRAREANAQINELAQVDAERAGMGTTLTAAYVGEHEVVIAHVGDSRAYRRRDGVLERLTQDHSLVAELVRRGKITEAEAEEHPQRSVITRALGPEPNVEVDVTAHPARAGDVYLICSDGLTSMVNEATVAEIMGVDQPLEAKARSLIAAANAAGGRDNITVILFGLEEVGGPPDAATEQPTIIAAGEAQAVREGLDASEPQPSASPAPVGAEAGSVPERRAALPPRQPRAAKPPMAASDPRPRRRWMPRPGPAAVVLILFAIITGGAWIASRAVYFLGTDSQGFVSVFRGVPVDLPAGIRLYERFYTSGVPAGELSQPRRKKLLDHTFRSQRDASDLVRRVEAGQLK